MQLHRNRDVHETCTRCSHYTVPKGTFLKATVDRGKEFACHTNVETTNRLHIYFADPYSSWQRTSNGNGKGLLRKTHSKGTDFAQVKDEYLAQSLHLINHIPRKYLGCRTAQNLSERSCRTGLGNPPMSLRLVRYQGLQVFFLKRAYVLFPVHTVHFNIHQGF
uniref:IS30 family transposase n=1 Tax=Paenibacillus sp. FSL K6-1318 TaxID=2975291 RepID=UPI00403F8546